MILKILLVAGVIALVYFIFIKKKQTLTEAKSEQIGRASWRERV